MPRAILRIQENFEKTDTLAVVSLSWKKNIPMAQRKIDSKKIDKWLKLKMKLNTLVVDF